MDWVYARDLGLGGREMGEADPVSSIRWNGDFTFVLEGKILKAYSRESQRRIWNPTIPAV